MHDELHETNYELVWNFRLQGNFVCEERLVLLSTWCIGNSWGSCHLSSTYTLFVLAPVWISPFGIQRKTVLMAWLLWYAVHVKKINLFSNGKDGNTWVSIKSNIWKVTKKDQDPPRMGSNLSISVTLWFLVEATSSTLPAAFRLMSSRLLDIAFDLLLSWKKIRENGLDPWHLVFLLVSAWLAQCLKKAKN